LETKVFGLYFTLNLQRHIKAGNGGDGSGDRSTGADGDDKYIEVPLGTVVKIKETGEILFSKKKVRSKCFPEAVKVV
jgi:GTPase involved in cell partitioning and DNA repair